MKAPRIDLLAFYSSPYSIYYIVQITQCKKSKVTYLKFAITPCPRYYWRGRMDQGLCNYMNQKDISAPRDSSRSKEAIRTWLRLMSCAMSQESLIALRKMDLSRGLEPNMIVASSTLSSPPRVAANSMKWPEATNPGWTRCSRTCLRTIWRVCKHYC